MRFTMRSFPIFFEGDGGAGGGMGAGAAATGDAGVTQAAAVPDRRSKRNPLANVAYGKQPDAASMQQESAQQDDAAVADPAQEWLNIRNNTHKAQFDADVQQIVQQRLKNSKEAEDKLGKLAPILESVAKKYGKDPSDIDGLIAAYNDDDSLYEEEAERRGIPVEALKTIKDLERKYEQSQAVNEQTAAQMRFQQHVQMLAQQAEQAKQVYPGLDLRAELANDTFRRLVSPEVNVDVRTAYEVVHRAELQNAMMQMATQKTQQQVVNAIQAGQRRPVENGVQRAPGLDVRDDPSKWTKQDRAEVRRRVRNGERIEL